MAEPKIAYCFRIRSHNAGFSESKQGIKFRLSLLKAKALTAMAMRI
jgi:hypothetical protein